MAQISIRGATTVENNKAEEILTATKALLEEIISQNQITVDQVISIIFTATKDLTKVYPAAAARDLGITYASLMCVQELDVEGSLEKCIRVSMTIESDKSQKEAKHVYLEKAKNLRPDLARKPKNMSIAIDGPNGAGKSTVAREVAGELGFVYVDTGAMYRAIGLYAIDKGIIDAPEAIINSLDDINLSLKYEQAKQLIFLNGLDVTTKIRTQEAATGASKVAQISKVREKLVKIQQDIAAKDNVVMDGRDIGSKVLPKADVKIYLEASIDVRTKRRVGELLALGFGGDYDKVKNEIQDRDNRDMSRQHSPLIKAEDATVLDTSHMDIAQARNNIINIFRNKTK